MKHSFYGIEIETTPAQDAYFKLFRRYVNHISNTIDQFLHWFQESCDSIDSFTKNSYGIGVAYFDVMVEMAVNDLFEHDIYTVDNERFSREYFSPENKWESFLNKVLDEYKKIKEQYQNNLDALSYEYADKYAQSQGGMRLQGGGFGIKGAAKGIAMAGMFNLVGDAVRSGRGARVESEAKAVANQETQKFQKRADDLIRSDKTINFLRQGFKTTAIEIFHALVEVLQENDVDIQFFLQRYVDAQDPDYHITVRRQDATNEAINEARAMLNNLKLPNFPEAKRLSAMQKVIEAAPHLYDAWDYMINNCDKPDFANIYKTATYFGVDISKYSFEIYNNIEDEAINQVNGKISIISDEFAKIDAKVKGTGYRTLVSASITDEIPEYFDCRVFKELLKARIKIKDEMKQYGFDDFSDDDFDSIFLNISKALKRFATSDIETRMAVLGVQFEKYVKSMTMSFAEGLVEIKQKCSEFKDFAVNKYPNPKWGIMEFVERLQPFLLTSFAKLDINRRIAVIENMIETDRVSAYNQINKIISDIKKHTTETYSMDIGDDGLNELWEMLDPYIPTNIVGDYVNPIFESAIEKAEKLSDSQSFLLAYKHLMGEYVKIKKCIETDYPKEMNSFKEMFEDIEAKGLSYAKQDLEKFKEDCIRQRPQQQGTLDWIKSDCSLIFGMEALALTEYSLVITNEHLAKYIESYLYKSMQRLSDMSNSPHKYEDDYNTAPLEIAGMLFKFLHKFIEYGGKEGDIWYKNAKPYVLEKFTSSILNEFPITTSAQIPEAVGKIQEIFDEYNFPKDEATKFLTDFKAAYENIERYFNGVIYDTVEDKEVAEELYEILQIFKSLFNYKELLLAKKYFEVRQYRHEKNETIIKGKIDKELTNSSKSTYKYPYFRQIEVIMNPIWTIAKTYKESVFYYPTKPMPDNKFYNAKSTILSEVDNNKETLLLVGDSTTFKSLKEGIAITDFAIYEYSEKSLTCIKLSDIDEANSTRGSSIESGRSMILLSDVFTEMNDWGNVQNTIIALKHFVAIKHMIYAKSEGIVQLTEDEENQPNASATNNTPSSNTTPTETKKQATTSSTPEQKDKMIKKALSSLVCGKEGLFLSESRIPPKKLTNAKKTFLNGVGQAEQLYIFYDSTVFGSGKDGFALTDKGVYYKNPFENTVFVQISEIVATKSSFSNLTILSNGHIKEHVTSLATLSHNAMIAKAILDIANILNN